MDHFEYGCVGLCLNACLSHFQHKQLLDPVPDEMTVSKLCRELTKRSIDFEITCPKYSLLRLKQWSRHTDKLAMARDVGMSSDINAVFVIGSAYEIYGISEPWLHTIVFLSDGLTYNLFDPYGSLASAEAKSFLKRQGLNDLILNRWTATIFARRKQQ